MVKAMRGVIPEGEVCYYVGILRPPVVAAYHVGSEFGLTHKRGFM